MSILNQVIYTGVVCYLYIAMGLTFAWPSSVLKNFSSANTTLNRPMIETEQSLSGSLASIGGLISTPLAGYLMDILGRKNCTILSALTHLIAWCIIVTNRRVEMILLAIFMSGLGGAIVLILPVYVSEICQESIRGTMTSGSLAFYSVGILLAYLLGGVLEYQVMVYTGLVMNVVGIGLLTFLRDTPVFLMKRGSEEDAAKAIAFYRSAKVDSKEVSQEMDALRRAFHPDLEPLEGEVSGSSPEEEKLKPERKITEKMSLWTFLKKSPSTRRATLVTFTLVTVAIFQGWVVIQVYAEPLFTEAVPNLSSKLCSILLSAVMLVAGLVTAYLTDVAGRRALMIYSSIGSGLCCILLATQLQLHWAPNLFTAVIIYTFCTTFTLGGGTVPFVLAAEVFLPEVRSAMSMFVIEWAYLCSFTILFAFNPLVSAMGLGPLYYVFAVICFLSAAFAFFYQPETKGLPVDVIQALFNKRKNARVV